jgi:hypothetical protein
MDILYKQNQKLDDYNYLMNLYIDTIHKLIDIAYSFNILPLKIMLGLSWIKKHISDNRFEALQNGITYLLENKDTILNFNLSKLDELDMDSDDNMSIKSCVNKFNANSNISNSNISNSNISNSNISNSNISNSNISNPDDMLNLMIEIKNNAKKLSYDDVLIVKKYFELLIIILEKIKNIFI